MNSSLSLDVVAESADWAGEAYTDKDAMTMHGPIKSLLASTDLRDDEPMMIGAMSRRSFARYPFCCRMVIERTSTEQSPHTA